jgi:hypothetical protein
MTPSTSNFTLSQPRLLLMLEGAALLIAAILLYAHLGGGLVIFILLLFVPDVSMIGYLINTTIGATIYNAVHSLILPLALGLIGLSLNNSTILQITCIWMAHIGLDRAVGYGLKYAVSFKDTHINRV